MHDSFPTYASRKLKNIHLAFKNVALFLPYFFSVKPLLKTLFQPWKNIVPLRNEGGSTPIQKAFENFIDVLTSRFIGFLVRGSILSSFVIVLLAYIFIGPFIYLASIMFIPLSFVFYLLLPSESENKQRAFQDFMRRHLTDEKNKQAVIDWFELYYSRSMDIPWWSLDALMHQPPLGRNLTSGFTATLDKYSTELTLQNPHHKDLIGRSSEIELVQRILTKNKEANVLLCGEEGVGREAIIEALSKSIYEGTSVNELAYHRVIAVEMEKILSLETDHIKRQELLHEIFKEAEQAGNIILVIRNLEKYTSNGESNIDLSQVFQKFALSSTLQFIATTTPYMYQKFIFPNKAIAELFDKVDVAEISAASTLRILLDIAPDIERRHKLAINYEALVATVQLADKHLTSSPFPEKAIELLDEACVYAAQHTEFKAVDAHIVATVLESMTHIPTELSAPTKDKLLQLEPLLRKRVLFQDQALTTVAATLRKSFVDAGKRKKPLASFLFLGPTGVGKTETAKAITQTFFDNEDRMLRFDMSNYQSKEDIPTLLGSAQTQEPGQLTQAIRNNEFGTLLLDELEKAHKDLLNIFLTLLDEGYFTDGYGKRVDCTHLIVIATSNAGADFIYQTLSQGKPTQETLSQSLIDHLVETGIYTPEFMNRFDGIVVYQPLYKDAILQIAANILNEIKANALSQHQLTVTFTPEYIQKLVDDGYDPRFGARNLRRLIQTHVEDRIAQAVLKGAEGEKTLTF